MADDEDLIIIGDLNGHDEAGRRMLVGRRRLHARGWTIDEAAVACCGAVWLAVMRQINLRVYRQVAQSRQG